jgi:hypothetical protein
MPKPRLLASGSSVSGNNAFCLVPPAPCAQPGFAPAPVRQHKHASPRTCPAVPRSPRRMASFLASGFSLVSSSQPGFALAPGSAAQTRTAANPPLRHACPPACRQLSSAASAPCSSAQPGFAPAPGSATYSRRAANSPFRHAMLFTCCQLPFLSLQHRSFLSSAALERLGMFSCPVLGSFEKQTFPLVAFTQPLK